MFRRDNRGRFPYVRVLTDEREKETEANEKLGIKRIACDAMRLYTRFMLQDNVRVFWHVLFPRATSQVPCLKSTKG